MNDAVCEANGITPNTINNVLSQNSNKSAFAGQVECDGQRVFVNVTAELKDIKNIQSLVVSEKGPLLLSDVAEVYFGVKEQTSLSRVNGKDAVSLRLSKDTQANLIALSDRTTAAIDEINADLEVRDGVIAVTGFEVEGVRSAATDQKIGPDTAVKRVAIVAMQTVIFQNRQNVCRKIHSRRGAVTKPASDESNDADQNPLAGEHGEEAP